MVDDSVTHGGADSDIGSTTSRRGMLRMLGGISIGATAGCLGLGGEQPNDEPSGRTDDWCVEENDTSVPEALLVAESIDGIVRDPEEVTPREDAAYQCHPQGYQLCANCRYFIPANPSETGDGIGACAIVAGRVRSQDWCALYQETQRLDEFPHPDPLGEPGIQKPP